MICVLFGAPGSGKGTQAELITTAAMLPHVSTGELLRAEAAAGTPLGQQVAPLLAAGELVPDELIERVLERRLEAPDAGPGAGLDGYPRTPPQATRLSAHLARSGRRLNVVLVLEVDEPTLMGRPPPPAAGQPRAHDKPPSLA